MIDHGWRDSAACLDHPTVTLDFFFSQRVSKKARALAVCARCDVRSECLADALRWPARVDLGIRGGMTEEARAQIARRPTASNEPRRQKERPSHETLKGYRWEMRRWGHACVGCTSAAQAYMRARSLAATARPLRRGRRRA